MKEIEIDHILMLAKLYERRILSKKIKEGIRLSKEKKKYEKE